MRQSKLLGILIAKSGRPCGYAQAHLLMPICRNVHRYTVLRAKIAYPQFYGLAAPILHRNDVFVVLRTPLVLCGVLHSQFCTEDLSKIGFQMRKAATEMQVLP